ncbi:hypothetical protein [Priestia megaterium]|uniref:hypothetical protein n=1 Tax=Priestia megaterium TaxID=1404 RepID=UPI002E2053F6|nr:hypothetical protein [Priestia megaterium]
MNTYLKVKDAANLLEVTSSALTKYYLLFEKHNYRFCRSIEGKLMFSNHDMELFRKLLQLKNAPNFTVEKAVVQLLEKNMDTFDLARQIQTLKLEYAEVKQLIQKQTEIIKMQQEQQYRIEELYKLHKKSVREIEEFIKQQKLGNQT